MKLFWNKDPEESLKELSENVSEVLFEVKGLELKMKELKAEMNTMFDHVEDKLERLSKKEKTVKIKRSPGRPKKVKDESVKL